MQSMMKTMNVINIVVLKLVVSAMRNAIVPDVYNYIFNIGGDANALDKV